MASKPGPSTSMGGVSMGGAGASMGPGPVSNVSTQEYTVRMPKDRHRKLALMKFATGVGVDFAKLGNTTAKLERENNLKEYKTANDLDQLPKFGAGSEYGRDQKEEARRKKYGIILKQYNPDEQPWHLKVGSGKQAKKYRGVREGTISENTSYFIFTQCADGAFEAIPVEEWYNFSPMIRYKYLNSDEAEEEFSRRDKTLNYFNIMLKKRVKNEDKDLDLDEEEKTTKGKGSKSKEKNRDFMLTDMEDWADISDFDDEMDDGDEDGDDERSKEEMMKEKKKKGKAAAKGKRRVKNAKQNSDDEAIEESDEGDFDDREVDYMSDSSSSGESEPEEKDKKYEEKGVADEGGLRNILNSDDEEEDEEEEVKEEEEIEDEDKKDDEKQPKEKKGGSDDSSSDSDSDSDIDKDEKITSALLMQKDRAEKKKLGDKGDNKAAGPASADTTDSRPQKRKAEGSDTSSAKKSKKDHSAAPSSSNSDGITEDKIRQYLQRKPMTTKDLLQKFRSKKLNLTIEQMSNTIAQLLKRINPERITINKKLYLSLK